MSLSAMPRYVLSPDEFAWLATIKETVLSWDVVYDQFIAKFPKCPVDRKKLQRAYQYYKNKLQPATTSSSEKPKPKKAEGATKRETQTGKVPHKRKAHEEPNHAKEEGVRRVSPRTMMKTTMNSCYTHTQTESFFLSKWKWSMCCQCGQTKWSRWSKWS